MSENRRAMAKKNMFLECDYILNKRVEHTKMIDKLYEFVCCVFYSY